MKPVLLTLGFVAALALGPVACSETTGAENFVGSWIYAGMVDSNCGDIGSIDLTGATATITKTDSSHIVVDLSGYCTVNFDADGFTARAAAGQTCSLPVPGFGTLPVSITSWTFMVSGDVIDSEFVGSALGCVPTGSGTLTRQSGGDAGAP